MTHHALVRWLPSEERGRAGMPPTLRYVGISRFEDDPPSWPDGAWSVELKFTQPPAEQSSSSQCEAAVQFLFDNAPQHRLHRGVRFSVYEGIQRVADVDVLD